MLDIELFQKYLIQINSFFKKGSILIFRGQEDFYWPLESKPIREKENLEIYYSFTSEEWVDFTLNDFIEIGNREDYFLSFTTNVSEALFCASKERRKENNFSDIQEILSKEDTESDDKLKKIKKIVSLGYSETPGTLYILHINNIEYFSEFKDEELDMPLSEFIKDKDENTIKYFKRDNNIYLLPFKTIPDNLYKKIRIDELDKKDLRITIEQLFGIGRDKNTLLKDKGEYYFYAGLTYQQNKNFNKALDCYNNSLEEGFKEDNLYYNRALVYLELKRYKDCQEDFEKISSANDFKDIDYYLALSYFESKDYDRAFLQIKYLEDNRKKEFITKIKQAYTEISRELLNKEDYVGAYNIFLKLLKLDKRNIELYDKMADIKYNLGENEEALKILKAALEIEENEELLLKKADLEFEEGNYENSIKDYKKALRLNGKNSQAYKGLALISLIQEDHKGAIEYYNSLIEIDDNSVQAYTGRANLNFLLQNYQEALKDYSRALLLKNDDSDIYFQRAKIYELLDKKIEALKDYNKALDLNPNLEEAYFHRGVLRFEMNKYEIAFQDFSSAKRYIEQNRENGHRNDNKEIEIHKYIAFCKKELNDLKTAYEEFIYVLRHNENDIEVLKELGEIKKAEGDNRKAISYFEKLIKTDPKKEYYLYQLAVMYFDLQEYRMALDYASRSIMVNSNNSDYYYLRGNIRKALTNFSEAILDYDKAININPNFSQAYISRGNSKKEIGNIKEAFSDFKQANSIKAKELEGKE